MFFTVADISALCSQRKKLFTVTDNFTCQFIFPQRNNPFKAVDILTLIFPDITTAQYYTGNQGNCPVFLFSTFKTDITFFVTR